MSALIDTIPKFEVVFVLGGPGSGKGTNCAKIQDQFGYGHLSAGDLLREERASGSELADMINNYIVEGKIVPAEVTVRLLLAAMEKSGKTKFLIDGFPRDINNLTCWQENAQVAQVNFLLFLDCPFDVMTARLLERGKTSGRSDDNEESIKKRLVTYTESTKPIIDWFAERGKCRTVDSNRDLDVVFSEVATHFAPPKFEVVFVLGGPGSGKGTNCAKIQDQFGYGHLSAGDLLREERASGSELADMINNYIVEGKIVPAEVTVRLLLAAMEKSGKTKFLIDGFPRDINNLTCWQENAQVAQVNFLLFLDCPFDVMTARLLERGKTSGRSDDNEESIKKRLVTYTESTKPIIDWFAERGKCRTVDSNRDLDVVFSEVATHFA
jgi:adenylate kinase